MPHRSLSLADKLLQRLAPAVEVQDLHTILSLSRSPNRFDSQAELAQHLIEGALLNISVLGSKALSLPCGEYMVWVTDVGHTMLVPTTDISTSREVYEHNTDAYEVQTRDLLANWNRIERVIAEDAPPQQDQPEPPTDNEFEEGEPDDDQQAGEFRSTVDASTVDRTPILRAMQNIGYTVTSLANAVGVDPPAISRILRTPDTAKSGDPGGRNPSMGLASQLCNVLRLDPTAAFPDIFQANERYQPRQQPANDQSGAHGYGNPVAKEDRHVQQQVNLLCEQFTEGHLDFDHFWAKTFIPTLYRVTAKTPLAAFTNSVVTEALSPQAEAAAQRMTATIMPGIQQAFQHAMQTLKQDLQQQQMKSGADPKMAPHAWEIMNRFYSHVLQAGKAYQPKWQSQAPGTGNKYDAAYQKARADFQPETALAKQPGTALTKRPATPTSRTTGPPTYDAEYTINKPPRGALPQPAAQSNRADIERRIKHMWNEK